MEKCKVFGALLIPAEIRNNKELDWNGRVLLTAISNLDNEKHCYASNEYLSEYCNISQASVTNWVKKLKDLNLIETEYSSDSRHRVIKVLTSCNKSFDDSNKSFDDSNKSFDDSNKSFDDSNKSYELVIDNTNRDIQRDKNYSPTPEDRRINNSSKNNYGNAIEIKSSTVIRYEDLQDDTNPIRNEVDEILDEFFDKHAHCKELDEELVCYITTMAEKEGFDVTIQTVKNWLYKDINSIFDKHQCSDEHVIELIKLAKKEEWGRIFWREIDSVY